MIKHCPACVGIPMLLFDGQGQNEIYGAQASISDNPDVVGNIDWGCWPFEGSPLPNVWACPRCGHHEPAGEDILAQQENRPRLFE